MNVLNYNKIRFLKSAGNIQGLPPDSGFEVAFAGRSNSGKSSALNTITGIHRLARTSKTPGRTQLINFFELDEERRLVDLPGYGYAKVSEKIKLQWQQLLHRYLTERQCLRGIVLLMDIRHPLTPLDWQMIEWGASEDLPIHILLTKSDKLGRGARQNTLLQTKKELGGYEDLITLQLFSSHAKAGIDEVHQKLDEWFEV